MENKIEYKTGFIPFAIMRSGEFIFKWTGYLALAFVIFGLFWMLTWFVPINVRHDTPYGVEANIYRWGGFEKLLLSIHILFWSLIGLIYYLLHFYGKNYFQDRNDGRNC